MCLWAPLCIPQHSGGTCPWQWVLHAAAPRWVKWALAASWQLCVHALSHPLAPPSQSLVYNPGVVGDPHRVAPKLLRKVTLRHMESVLLLFYYCEETLTTSTLKRRKHLTEDLTYSGNQTALGRAVSAGELFAASHKYHVKTTSPLVSSDSGISSNEASPLKAHTTPTVPQFPTVGLFEDTCIQHPDCNSN